MWLACRMRHSMEGERRGTGAHAALRSAMLLLLVGLLQERPVCVVSVVTNLYSCSRRGLG